MPKISKNVWERLRKAGIIDTYDRELRNDQIRRAGPWKLMSIAGIGIRTARLLLKNAGWDISMDELKDVYDKLWERTQFENVKAKPRAKEKEAKEIPREKPTIEEPADKKERRYIALLLKAPKSFDKLFSAVKKSGGIPYNGKKPHKILHLTLNPPQDILLADAKAKLYGIINYKLPSSFEIVDSNKFPNVPKVMFFGNLDFPSKLIQTPHVTFGEFENDGACLQFFNSNQKLFEEFKGMKMEIESIAIVKKDYGVEYAIPLAAIKEETRTFIPEQIRTFLEFLGHKNPIKYQVFAPLRNGEKVRGSIRNTYVKNIDEFINLARIDNGKGIVCVAIGEHGNKQSEKIDNITKLLALVIDADVKKDRKINYVSTKEDHLHADNVSYVFIKREFEHMGFGVGLIVDSGNGAHTYVKVGIDLPGYNSAEEWHNSKIYRRLLAIEQKIRKRLTELNDAVITVDFITKDVVRRPKVAGTINKKDENQAEDRVSRIIYKADDYAEESNNNAFFKIEPAEAEQRTEISSQTETSIPAESKTVLDDEEVERILNNDQKLKALFEGKVVCHGEDKKLEFKDGKIYSKSRSEAENSLVSGLVANGIRNFGQIDKIMSACKIGKWQEDKRGSYRRKTFEKAMSFVKTMKISGKEVSDFERLMRSVTEIKK
ncbi:MAG: hypothetical protein AABX74_01760 [Nanoarchaeota archaeon]